MDNSDVLALKYRPKKLADVIGQDVAVQLLTNAFTSEKMYQTLIFCGMYGTGKTSCARIVAAMENCESGPTLEPCGTCKNCRDIFEGRSLDVRELNAASSRGIDDIRDIAEWIRPSPLTSRVKFVILDECLGHNSLIETEDGLIPVSRIVNDRLNISVKSFNDNTKNIEYKPITGWFKNSGKQLFRVGFESKGTIEASDGHLFATPSGYKELKELNVGDLVLRENISNSGVLVEKIASKKTCGYENVTYDIEVADNHNYFVSGTLVHNCHRLTPDAAESALKMLEEPPRHVKFCLCTTDLHRMKVTLQSRGMPLRFVKVPWPLITDHLKNIATKEKYDFDEQAIKIAARLSDGSVRNALRNLQLLQTFSGGSKMTSELAQRALGAIDDNHFFSFIESVISKDAATSMKTINTIIGQGVEFQQIFDGLLEHLRTLLVVMTCHNTATLVYLSEEEKKGFIHQIGNIDKKLSITDTDDKQRSALFISNMISLLCSVARGVNLNINPQTLLEQFAIESIMAFAKLEREGKAKTT